MNKKASTLLLFAGIILASTILYANNTQSIDASKKVEDPKIVPVKLKKEQHQKDYLTYLDNQEKIKLQQEKDQKLKEEQDKQIAVDLQKKQKEESQQNQNLQQNYQTDNQVNNQQKQSTVQQINPVPKTQERTDGFNIAGMHFGLQNYYDNKTGNEMPLWTPYVYKFIPIQNYYLVEGQSDAGNLIRPLGTGTKLVLNGESLTMVNILSINRTDPNAYGQMEALGSQHKAVVQTCYDSTGNNLKIMVFD